MKKKYDYVVEKAQSLIKLAVPEGTFQKGKKEKSLVMIMQTGIAQALSREDSIE